MRSGRALAFGLLGAAVVVLLIGVIWLGVSYSEGGMRVGGLVIGLMLLMVIVLPLGIGGVVMLTRSRGEAEELGERQELRKILDMVKARGQVPISDVVLELASSRKEVQDQIYSLVGMGLFSGYINWDEGVLFSQQASSLRELDRCKNCGGELKLAGKGVVTCPYCGTEYFLS